MSCHNNNNIIYLQVHEHACELIDADDFNYIILTNLTTLIINYTVELYFFKSACACRHTTYTYMHAILQMVVVKTL